MAGAASGEREGDNVKSLFPEIKTRSVSTTPEIEKALASGSPIGIGVSGGKDSCAVAFRTNAYLNEIGHRGPRLLIHSDLGSVEWRESLPVCRQLADVTGLELVTVKRAAGGLMERWHTRWQNNVHRYANMECVKLILPWSTPSMRFCTSELKTAIICRELTQRFSGQTILSVTGIRREESSQRAKSPIYKTQARLTRASRDPAAHGTRGFDWHPILDWSKQDVFDYLAECDFPLHEAYTTYGSSRVSCCFCILGAKADLKAATRCDDNENIYREMVELEISSTFSFQDSQWLGDIAPDILGSNQRERLEDAKRRACLREGAEARIPKHLLYTKGWPTCIPTLAEAEMLCEVRAAVAGSVGLTISYDTPDALIARYEELMAQNNLRKVA